MAGRDEQRRSQLIALWRKRAAEKRPEDDILAFYGELEREHPQLLKRGRGDPYQQLKVDLRGHIEPKN